MNRSDIEMKLQDLAEEKRELEYALKSIKGRKFAACSNNCYGKGCGKRTRIGKLTAINLFWHVQPSGCSGGDYWLSSNELQWDCPKCGHRNRCYKSTYGGDHPELYEFKEFFGRQVASHDSYGYPPAPDEP